MRLTIPKFRTWHLLGIVAASAALFSAMQSWRSIEDPGYVQIRRLRSMVAGERAEAAARLAEIRPPERRAIAPLTEMIFDPDAGVRAASARALLNILDNNGDDLEAGPVKAALTSALGDRDRDARWAIAYTLGNLGPEPGVVVPTVLEFAEDGNASARAEAVPLLGQFGRRSEPALAAVFAMLDDADVLVRCRSVEALSSCSMFPGVAPEPILERIKVALDGAADDGSPRVRVAAVTASGRLGARTRSEALRVIRALGDPDAAVRLAAATHLSWGPSAWGDHGRRSPTLLPTLGRALTDPDARVRRATAVTLGHLGLDAEDALPGLRALPDDPVKEVREQVAEAISTIDHFARDFHPYFLPTMIDELGNTNPATRALTARVLEDLGPKAAGAVPALVRCLVDGEADVRRASAAALGQLGPGAAVALPMLAKLAESDPDERVRQAACLSRSTLAREGGGGDRAP